MSEQATLQCGGAHTCSMRERGRNATRESGAFLLGFFRHRRPLGIDVPSPL
jgi:hypothetical protein